MAAKVISDFPPVVVVGKIVFFAARKGDETAPLQWFYYDTEGSFAQPVCMNPPNNIRSEIELFVGDASQSPR